MSVLFPFGDIITISKLARTLRRRFRNASSQFEAISAEVDRVTLVLGDVDESISERELTDPQKARLSTLTEGCWKALHELEAKLDQYDGLGKHAQSSTGKEQKAWMKMTWDQDEIMVLRSRLAMNTTTLDMFNQELSRSGALLETHLRRSWTYLSQANHSRCQRTCG
ncbi:MAG: hypothetical protein M4579_004128 [Chaenotheca gracillima]|nr:MAG: hypothetical protein M4579_004128 [Chaenotheca gracillima]